MSREIKIKVYQYSELSPAAQQRAREWWRSGDDSHESWSDHVTEDLKTVAAFMGWKITGTAFSGFSSQGDGAQFHGTWEAAKVKDAVELEKHAPPNSPRNVQLRDIMSTLAELAKDAPDTSATVRQSGRYSHSNATGFNSYDMSDEQLSKLVTASRELMDWYYRGLELSYNHEMSDEVVAETITDKQYEFKANGDRFID